MTTSAEHIRNIIDKYKRVRDQRLPAILNFQNGKRPFLIYVQYPKTSYVKCSSVEDSFQSNMADFNFSLNNPSHMLPYLEPWFGTGAYASAFGCEYVWRDNESPACHYAYKKIEQIAHIQKPDVNSSPILRMILDAIRYFRDKTS